VTETSGESEQQNSYDALYESLGFSDVPAEHKKRTFIFSLRRSTR
jgi:hypothetical protein